MYKQLIEELKPELEKTIQFLRNEFLKIKTSRANPAMVEDIMVDCYDQKMPIKQLANINTPQPRLITIQPWDKEILQELEKAIRNQSSLSPVVDGDLIRINIPPLSEDQRKEYVKTYTLFFTNWLIILRFCRAFFILFLTNFFVLSFDM